MEEVYLKEISIIFDRIVKEYYNFKKLHQNQLYDDFGIDCGIDYARYILNELVYDKNGSSIY